MNNYLASISRIDNSIPVFPVNGQALESEEIFNFVDLICDGPIEGICDKNGNLLQYISTSAEKTAITLGLGVYFNNVPIIDSETKKFNFSNVGFDLKYGAEWQEKIYFPSTTYRYAQRLYLNDANFEVPLSKNNSQTHSIINYTESETPKATILDPVETTNPQEGGKSYSNAESYVQNFEAAKENVNEFVHKIINRYTNKVSVGIKTDSLYQTDKKGNVKPLAAQFVIEFSKEGSADKTYFFHYINGVSKAGFTYSFEYSINKKVEDVFYVKVYILSQKIKPTDVRKNILLSLDYINEYCNIPLFYPLYVINRSFISARHFQNVPSRTFDMKLAKVNVPSNYDPEAKEHIGDWDGKFDNFLRWTDNPAYIYWDLILNTRRGVGSEFLSSSDLNRWEIYRIAKYCDELVKTSFPQLHDEDTFIYTYNKNVIKVPKDGRTLEEFKRIYPPISDPAACDLNGGEQNSIIYLYDLEIDYEASNKRFKKIIGDVYSFDDTYFAIQLLNDFGPRKVLEEDNGDFIKSLAITTDSNDIVEQINVGLNNSEFYIKRSILQRIGSTLGDSAGTNAGTNILQNNAYLRRVMGLNFSNAPVFPFKSSSITGTCLPKSKGYQEKLEPRFTANVYINGETEALKLLNDMASIFRGITYYKSGLISTTIDVNKPIAYLFTNTNVKEGRFNYINGAVDGNYTVAKVFYKDKDRDFEDVIESVEDPYMVKNYGIIEKEILGFGITSKGQAQRLGQWLLLTNRLENETVTFSSNVQGVYLQPSNIIRIEDRNRSFTSIQGKVLDYDSSDFSITVDRKINLDFTNKLITFLVINKALSITEIEAKDTVTDEDIENLSVKNTIDCRILSIDNKNNKIFLDQNYNYSNFSQLKIGTVFVIQSSGSTDDNLYKIISISEINPNEFGFFCMKHDPQKYQFLDGGGLEKTSPDTTKTISFSNEVDIREFISYTPTISSATIANLPDCDYTFYDNNGIISTESKQYLYITIDPNAIQDLISASNLEAITGGFIVKVTYKNNTLSIKIPISDTETKTIFLGAQSQLSANIKVYGYDVNNRIINAI